MRPCCCCRLGAGAGGCVCRRVGACVTTLGRRFTGPAASSEVDLEAAPPPIKEPFVLLRGSCALTLDVNASTSVLTF